MFVEKMKFRKEGNGCKNKPLGIVIMEGTRGCGFGHSAHTVNTYDYVTLLTTEQFNEMKDANAVTSYHTMGMNAGSPRDGLEEVTYLGLRCLVDSRSGDDVPIFADIATLPDDIPVE
jgi:hypothetical protein